MSLLGRGDRELLLGLLALPTAGPLEAAGGAPELWEAQRRYAAAAGEFGFDVVHHAAPAPGCVERDDVPLPVREAAAVRGDFLACQPSMVLALGAADAPLWRTVMFNVHLDTVAGFEPVAFDGERFHGRGAIDAKGPAVALLAGLRQAVRERPGLLRDARVLVQAVAGEEGGALGTFGTRPLVEAGHYGRLNVFCEPTGGRALARCTAAMTARLSVRGRDAIDDRPEAGHNATVVLGHLAQHLAAALDPELDPAEGQLCVAGLHTGMLHNKVYGQGQLLLNLSYGSPAAARRLEGLVAEAVAEGVRSFTAAFRHTRRFARTAADAADLVRLDWLKRGLPALDGDPAWLGPLLGRAGVPWWPASEPGFTCDAIWMSGVPGAHTVVLGPGSLDANHAHAEGEFADLAELDAFAATVPRLLNAFLASPPPLRQPGADEAAPVTLPLPTNRPAATRLGAPSAHSPITAPELPTPLGSSVPPRPRDVSVPAGPVARGTGPEAAAPFASSAPAARVGPGSADLPCRATELVGTSSLRRRAVPPSPAESARDVPAPVTLPPSATRPAAERVGPPAAHLTGAAPGLSALPGAGRPVPPERVVPLGARDPGSPPEPAERAVPPHPRDPSATVGALAPGSRPVAAVSPEAVVPPQQTVPAAPFRCAIAQARGPGEPAVPHVPDTSARREPHMPLPGQETPTSPTSLPAQARGDRGDRGDTVRLGYEELLGFVTEVFVRCGVPAGRAATAAEALCYGDLVGMDSHGLANLTRLYLPLFEEGRVDAGAEPVRGADLGAAVRLDARRALGLWAGAEAMDLAVERAGRYGIGLVSVHNGTHLGCAGYHAVRAARHGMVGLLASNCGRQRIARPPGGRVTMLGTNPLAVAAPAGPHHPFVLDMSTTVAPTGRVRAAARAGRPVPEGWLTDDAGRPVTDPAAFDRGEAHLGWLGGTPDAGAYKGYGLGLAVEVLAGLVSGAGLGPAREALDGDGRPSGRDDDIGYLAAAIAPSLLREGGEFASDADALFGSLLDCPPLAAASPVRYPGWAEGERARTRRTAGVPVTTGQYGELVGVAASFGLTAPAPMGGAR